MFTFKKMAIPEVVRIIPEVFTDKRGYLMETYRRSDFAACGISAEFVQDNLSCSAKGVLRGLHYQLHPHAQGKLVQVLCGAILDVAVDIRRGSPTYGKWVSALLSAQNKEMLWIPRGFAHGFLALEDNSMVLYRNDAEYHAQSARSIIWNDSTINIDWGDISSPVLSEKDKHASSFKRAEINYTYQESGGAI